MTHAYLSEISSTDRILRFPELREKVGYSRSNIRYLTEMGEFPPSIKLGGRAVGWLESEVDNWIQNSIALSRKGDE